MEGNQEKRQDMDKSLTINSNLHAEPESHLESLGFTKNNGKARFKLDDDTPMYSNTALSNFSVVESEDTLSFVVLGKDSMDSIQASSLASYVDIQQKSMSVDYQSMIELWDSTEIHHKLNELLQENGKLKETLKQNTIAMKQQFNTLASWQEEIMKVHQNHKKKFAETRELINYLKKENTDLKTKLCNEYPGNTEIGYEVVNINDSKSTKEIESSIPVVEFQEKVSSLIMELNASKLKCDKLSADVEKLTSMSSLMSSQLKQATSIIQEQRFNINELTMQASMSKSCNNLNSCPRSSDYINLKECDNCLMKDKEINSLKESVAMLQNKLQHVTTPVQLGTKDSVDLERCYQQYSQKMKLCNEKLQECLQKEINYCGDIEDCIKEFLEALDSGGILNKSMRAEDTEYSWLSQNTNSYNPKEHLSNCYKKLIDERQKFVAGKQNIIFAQDQFQKTLLDCNSILYELELLLERNIIDNIPKSNEISEASQKNIKLQEQMMEDKRLEEERLSLARERESLEDEKKLFDSQKRNLEMEYKNLNDEKELLQQERISLHEEKSSLDQQSQLYEDHGKTLQMEKKKFQTKYDQLITEIGTLHQCIERKEKNIKELQKEIKQQMENMDLLQTQVKVYEEDFKLERNSKQELLKEKANLSTDLQKQIEFNEQLQQEINRGCCNCGTHTRVNQTSVNGPTLSIFECPKCNVHFTSLLHLEEHIHHCLVVD